MDGLRFDNLARTVAAGASRRSVLKGLAAGLAATALRFAGAGIASAQNTVPLGGQCSGLGANSECSQAGGAVVCSDNGVARDGQFNCCRNAGGACTADFHCCGGAVCVDGSCGGGGERVACRGLGLGAECTATSQCSQAGGSVVCASNGIAADGARNCCRNTGGACTGDIQCCARPALRQRHLWRHGELPRRRPAGGLAPGAACTSDRAVQPDRRSAGLRQQWLRWRRRSELLQQRRRRLQRHHLQRGLLQWTLLRQRRLHQQHHRRSGSRGLLHADRAVQPGGRGRGLRLQRHRFRRDAQLLPQRRRARATGTSSAAAGCLCLNGACSSGEGSGGTIGLGGQCAATGECSQAGGAVFCDDNGIASDGALNCCRYEGGGCATGSQCCGGLDCTNGVCTPIGGGQGGGNIALGGECAADGECTATGGPSFCRNNGLDSGWAAELLPLRRRSLFDRQPLLRRTALRRRRVRLVRALSHGRQVTGAPFGAPVAYLLRLHPPGSVQ